MAPINTQMKIRVVEFSKVADPAAFFDFLKQINTDDPANDNMWSDDWQNQPNTLPYILTNTNKFTGNNGEFHVVLDGKKIIACGGVQITHFCNKIGMCGIRTWVLPEYRNKMIIARYLLPKNKAWAVEHGCKQVALSFNDYNRNLARLWTRVRAGESADRISKRTPDMMFYNGVNELKFPIKIQYTPQWVIYERLDPEWEFNWQALKAGE